MSFLAVFPLVSSKLPSSIRPCSRDDPHLERCIIDAVYKIRPLLVHGDLGDGYKTPPLEPLALDDIELGRSSQFQAVFQNLEALGGNFRGTYSLNLNLLLLDIKGRGNMQGYCENAKASVKMRGTRYQRNGQDFAKFTKMTMRIQFKDFKLNLENLFNGDRILGDVGNRLINNNQDLYLNEIVPGLERGLSKKFLDVANEILATATFDEMFPPGKTIINPISFPSPSPPSDLGPSIFETPFASRNPEGSILAQLPPRNYHKT
nr:uncharacterized protein LOC108125042 [Drosophila bipectinata]